MLSFVMETFSWQNMAFGWTLFGNSSDAEVKVNYNLRSVEYWQILFVIVFRFLTLASSQHGFTQLQTLVHISQPGQEQETCFFVGTTLLEDLGILWLQSWFPYREKRILGIQLP